jgi:glycosyltransferase involved in cell wall biosynthesis
VIHRFGADIAGGSEAHCRGIAERLAERHDVTVFTTTARDHVTWKNELPPGVTRDGRIEIRRFPVERMRSIPRFSELSEIVFSGAGSEEDQHQWFRENGPQSPQLVDDLAANAHRFDRILFWSFRYYQSYFGVPRVGERAVLVPTAEDDPVMRLDVLERLFALPSGFVFLTPEEKTLVERRAAAPLAPSCIVGTGLNPAAPVAVAPPAGLDLAPPFILYLGRIDPNKGCGTLVRHFLRFIEDGQPGPPLVMAGPANMPLPEHPRIRRLGFVDETTRSWLLRQASVLVVPSLYESLSIVLLEAWNCGVPALANGRCAVLAGQIARANGGLCYRSYDEFAAALTYLASHPEQARQLGRQGLAYVDREYRWPRVMGSLESFLESLPIFGKAASVM